MNAIATEIHCLRYDRDEGRWYIGEHGLHCGDCFLVQVGGHWCHVRIEHCGSDIDNGWYLIGAPWREFPNSPSIEGLACREYE